MNYIDFQYAHHWISKIMQISLLAFFLILTAMGEKSERSAGLDLPERRVKQRMESPSYADVVMRNRHLISVINSYRMHHSAYLRDFEPPPSDKASKEGIAEYRARLNAFVLRVGPAKLFGTLQEYEPAFRKAMHNRYLALIPELHAVVKREFCRTRFGCDGDGPSVVYATLNERKMLVLSFLLMSQTELETLNLDSNQLTADGLKHLARVLPLLVSLKELMIVDNEVDEWGVSVVGASLPLVIGLRQLHLEQNDINDAGIDRLLRVLPSMHHLELVNLYGNDFGVDGIKAIASFLAEHKSNKLVFKVARGFLWMREWISLTNEFRDIQWILSFSGMHFLIQYHMAESASYSNNNIPSSFVHRILYSTLL